MSNNDLKTATQGTQYSEVVDSSAADEIPVNKDCRGISVDTDGYVKYDQGTPQGTKTCIRFLSAGSLFPAWCVTKVYRYYTGTTTGATVMKADGTLTVGLRLEL